VVEGCARRTREYVQFLSVATGSAAQAEYLLDMSQRLEMLNREEAARLRTRDTELVKD
jgi:four helix bundle protein